MEGILAAYGDKVRFLEDDYRVLLSAYPAREGKVGIVTAGGSGHLPVFLGYVGQGSIDDLRHNARFVKITSASFIESHPHDISITKEAPNYSPK